MSTLIKQCNNIVRETISLGCNANIEAGYPKYLIYGVYGSTIAAIGTTPTPAEVQTYLNAGKGLIIPITNGAWIAPDKQSISGADTADGLEDVTREDNGVSGNFKIITNDIMRMFAQNNLNNNRAQLWVIDSNDQLHGAKTGFTIPFYIMNFEHSGYGSKAFIALSHKWERKPNVFVPISLSNVAYASLVNETGTYTETVVTTYVAGQVQGYSSITGWDKATYPILYAKIVSNVITFYDSDAHRSSGTNALATCDSGTSLAVAESNSSGFGGSLTFVSNAITDASGWNIAYTA